MAVLTVGLCWTDLNPVYAQEAETLQPHRHQVRVEAGYASGLRSGDERDGYGAGFALGYEYRGYPFLGITAQASSYLFPYDDTEFTGSGMATYNGLGLGLRVHALPAEAGLDLWVEAGAKYVLTGDLKRAGVEIGVGLDWKLEDADILVGPFARYAHVFQPDEAAQGPQEGRFFQFGVGLSWGIGSNRVSSGPVPQSLEVPKLESDTEEEAVAPAVERPAVAVEAVEAVEAPPLDTDSDGVPDAQGPCPKTVYDSADGCPAVPIPEAIEVVHQPEGTSDAAVVPLAEFNPRFVAGRAVLGPVCRETLKHALAVIRAEDSESHIRVIGHADHRGSVEMNERLSRRRAEAVARWLVRNGLDRSRMEVEGVGSRHPHIVGTHHHALDQNRRVEIVLLPGLLNPPEQPSEPVLESPSAPSPETVATPESSPAAER